MAKYYVTVAVSSRFTCAVEAESIDEAREKGETEFECADNETVNANSEVVSSKACIVEDENGNILWDN